MNKHAALLTLAAALALCGVSDAQTPPQGPPPGGFRGGGLFLSPSGEPFRGPGGEAAWFAGADANHDGALTLAEFRADAMRFFQVLDANHDGVIDGSENQIYETRIAPEILGMGREDPEDGPRKGGGDEGPPGGGMGGMGGMGGPGGGMGGMGRGGGPGGGMDGPGGGDSPRPPSRNFSRLEGAARYALINEPQPVRGADLNLDWKVTAEEWAKASGRRFALLDPKETGKLVLADLPPAGGRGAEGPRRKGGMFKHQPNREE